METTLKGKERLPDVPVITILTPVYNEEECLPLFEKKARELFLSREDYNFKVLFIEDGSTDRSWEIIREICERNDRFRGIRLSRNYGSHIALCAGFAHAEGDALATLACDLQDPPEVILEFLEKWRAGAKIVWGKRRSRDEDAKRVFASRVFYLLMRRFAMPRGSRFATGSFFLIDRQVAECFSRFQESNRITFALVAWTGFDQAEVLYDRTRRAAGQSGWSFLKMIKTMYDAFIGFSFLPVKIMTGFGLGAFFVAFFLSLYIFLSWLTGNPLPGWTSLMLMMAFFFGVQFLLMGLIGEYLYRIYSEVVRRPLFFISERTSGE